MQRVLGISRTDANLRQNSTSVTVQSADLIAEPKRADRSERLSALNLASIVFIHQDWQRRLTPNGFCFRDVVVLLTRSDALSSVPLILADFKMFFASDKKLHTVVPPMLLFCRINPVKVAPIHATFNVHAW